MQQINWGIIGCGDVTEVKSGPAFNKVPNSSLIAVMRRDGAKAKDYAERHQVPKWYDNADQLINDPDVNAIYIATPPSSHEEYTLASIAAGKPVYVEKPMTLNAASALKMNEYAKPQNVKLVVAHYRRALPFFIHIKELMDNGGIGDIRFVRLLFCTSSLTTEALQNPKIAWRVDPAVAGGGLFHDLSPHQLDLMYHFFGPVKTVNGFAVNQQKQTAADDMVSGSMLFESGVLFNGLWCFNAAPGEEADRCEIVGSKGKISFGFFGKHEIDLTVDGKLQTISFDPPAHIQQPMIEKVVNYFLDNGPNPCPAADGVTVMRLIDGMTAKK